jgi:ABC-type multidrug transport system permease subunit
MTASLVQACFVVCMLALIAIGFYCSHQLDNSHPSWVRLIVLLPCLTAFATLAAIGLGAYVAYWPDVASAVSGILVYALVASRFTSRPWLDIRTGDKP